MSKPKIAATVTVLAVLAVLAGLIPLPLHVKAPFLIEPADARTVYVATPGELTQVHVAPGDRVAEGDVLAVLSNAEIEDELRQLEAELETEVKRADAFESSRNEAEYFVSRDRIAGLEKQIADVKQRIAQLTLRAPAAGIVVAPTAQPGSEGRGQGETLPTWSGTPLEERNRGAYLEPGAALLVVAPVTTAGKVEATLLVDQADRNDVVEGQEVELRFDHIPDTLYESKVETFARRHVEFAPPPLSNKFGGPLATVSEQDGRERLSGNAYQATVLLDADPELMRPGLLGTARLDAANRSAWAWAWRTIRQTFHFGL